MVCDFEINDAFRNLGNIVCPFCHKQLHERVVKNEPCCAMMQEKMLMVPMIVRIVVRSMGMK